MALVINDRVKETTTTTGTGTITLAGAVQGFETFAAGIGNSNTTYYCITLGSEFEVGLGTLSGDSSTLARTTIISSSNSDSAVNFSAGSKFVFCCLPASKTTILDASNNLTLPGKLIMPDVTSGKILVGDGTSYEEVAVSGDIGLASSGAMTIQSDAVEQSMIADDAVGADQLASSAVVTASIVDDNVTQAKIANDAVGADQLAANAVVTASIVDDNVTQAKIADDAVGADQLAANAVVNASVASDAAIADTKLATISTANKVDIGALDIDGASDIGAALADADLVIVDDGANGTEKKCAVSRIKTYIADVTLTTAAQTNITSLGTLTTLTVDNIIINGTNIGHTSDTDSIAIASNGVVTFSQAPVFPDGSLALADLDIDGGTDIGAGLADADLIIVDDGAGGTNRKSAMSRVKTYIADVTLTTAAQTNITSLGTLTTLTVDNIIINGTNIGHTSDTDAIAIASDGVVTFSQRDVHSGGITIADGGQIGSASDTDAIAIGSDGDVTLTQDLELQHDGAILSFGANDEITLTHVHDTGLLLGDSGGTPTLQLHDANESIASDGSKVIITSGGTAFNLPTADGSSGQVLQTNGSGTLSFASASGGKVKQIVSASDATLYAISITNSTSDHAGTIAYSITPSSTSHKVMIHFTIPQVKHAQHAGLRVRLYRQINGGGYSHVSGLSGTASSNKQAALFGNYDTNGDGNRSATTITGTVVDSPSTTAQVDYKFYFGAGDGATTVYVNRTQNDTDLAYTHRTRTHVTLVEIE